MPINRRRNILKHVIKRSFARSPYLCIVFFIVLDLRLTKVGVQRYSFFYARMFRFPLFQIFSGADENSVWPD